MIDPYDIARFWSKVDVLSQDTCWQWRGYVNKDGYDEVYWDGQTAMAHRVAFTIVTGQILGDEVIRHSCDTPRCCNPRHLLDGTHADNVADRVARDRSAKGEDNGRAILNEEQVRHILVSTLPNKGLGTLYGVSPDTIKAIRCGRIWKHVFRDVFGERVA